MGKEPDPSQFHFKRTSDSENFFIEIGGDIEDGPPENRKAKLHNVLEAYFKYRIDRLKNPHDQTRPISILIAGLLGAGRGGSR